MLIGGNAGGGPDGIEPRVATNLARAEGVYRDLGYDVVRVPNPRNASEVSAAIKKQYPDGYGSRTAVISSCQSGGVCRNVDADPELANSYGTVVATSREPQLSSDFPTQRPGDPTIEAGLGNYLTFKQDPLKFDANNDGNVTGSEFQRQAVTPGSASYKPAALLIPTNLPNNFVEVDRRADSGLERSATGAPNILNQGPGRTVVENSQYYYPQEMQVLRGDNILYSLPPPPPPSPAYGSPSAMPAPE